MRWKILIVNTSVGNLGRGAALRIINIILLRLVVLLRIAHKENQSPSKANDALAKWLVSRQRRGWEGTHSSYEEVDSRCFINHPATSWNQIVREALQRSTYIVRNTPWTGLKRTATDKSISIADRISPIITHLASRAGVSLESLTVTQRCNWSSGSTTYRWSRHAGKCPHWTGYWDKKVSIALLDLRDTHQLLSGLLSVQGPP